jgi:biotin transporter BioY
VAGAFADRGWTARLDHAAVALLSSLLVLYAGGIAWMAMALPTQSSAQIVAGIVPFFLSDLIKACAVAAGASAATRVLDRTAA